jgi:dolichol-phosphate mannosyltransferase
VSRPDDAPGAPPATGVAPPLRVLVSLFAFNEGEKLRATLGRFPRPREYDVLLVDDGTTDGSTGALDEHGVILLRNPRNEGLGASIRKACHYALDHDYDVLVIMAGNGKDDPLQIERLLEPLYDGRADFVQGSRFLPGGSFGNMPWHRVVATRIAHPLLFSLLSGTRVTESTNGFRALRTSILRDARIDWQQAWLDQYELEQYLHFKVVRLGYRRLEVPVTKQYPETRRGYTKVKPITGWWSMIKPLVYLACRIRR